MLFLPRYVRINQINREYIECISKVYLAVAYLATAFLLKYFYCQSEIIALYVCLINSEEHIHTRKNAHKM